VSGPDREQALERYQRLADSYDRRVERRSLWLREAAVARLALRPGETVVDVGCGTGLTFPLLERRIGPSGRLIGIEMSGEMLSLARGRVANEGWANVELIEAPAEGARLPRAADAALFVLTHDITQNPAALANVLSQLRGGARVVAAGPKLAPRWAFPVNLAVRALARPYVTTFEGMQRPWRHLERLIADLEVERLALGGAYLASGETAGASVGRAVAGGGAPEGG
jgi:SAM-dependent methyltransferase